MASGVTDMVAIPQLEVSEEYWLINWISVAPMGIWSRVLSIEAAHV